MCKWLHVTSDLPCKFSKGIKNFMPFWLHFSMDRQHFDIWKKPAKKGMNILTHHLYFVLPKAQLIKMYSDTLHYIVTTLVPFRFSNPSLSLFSGGRYFRVAKTSTMCRPIHLNKNKNVFNILRAEEDQCCWKEITLHQNRVTYCLWNKTHPKQIQMNLVQLVISVLSIGFLSVFLITSQWLWGRYIAWNLINPFGGSLLSPGGGGGSFETIIFVKGWKIAST